MRYMLYAFGLSVAAAVSAPAAPATAGDWLFEPPPVPLVPAAPKKQAEAHPLVGKWLDTRLLRLIEFKERGELVDSGRPAGGLTWMPIALKQQTFRFGRTRTKLAVWGSLRVAEMSFREVYDAADSDLLGDGSSGAGQPLMCVFTLGMRGVGCRIRDDLDSGAAMELVKLDPESAKKPDRICLGLCGGRNWLGGQYDRVQPDDGEQEVPIFDSWVETESGRAIVFSTDGKVAGLNGADGALLPGEWGKVAPRAPAANADKDYEVGRRRGEGWIMQILEEGSLAVRIGGSMTLHTRIALCQYRIGYTYDARGIREKDTDVDTLKLWGCRVSWAQDQNDLHEKGKGDSKEKDKRDPKLGSRIVRVLTGERLDVKGLETEKAVVLWGMDRR